MTKDPRSEALRAITRFAVSDASLSETLEQIASITTTALAKADFAGMTLLDERAEPTTAVFTSELSPEIDAAQYRSGEGPCLDAWRERRVIVLPETTDPAAPYEAFRRSAAAHGVRSTLSLPLAAEEGALGALNLYSSQPGGFDHDAVSLGVELSGVAAVLVQNSVSYWGAFELTRQIDEALHSRATIEQAKGILMGRTPGLDASQAFDQLRLAADREQLALRDLAARVVRDREL